MSRGRKMGLAVASGVLAMGALAPTASAVPRTFVLTMVDGSTMTYATDVPADMPVDEVPLPETPQQVMFIDEVTPAPTPTTAPTWTSTPVPVLTATVTPTPTGTPTSTATPEATPTAEIVIPDPVDPGIQPTTRRRPRRDRPDRDRDRTPNRRHAKPPPVVTPETPSAELLPPEQRAIPNFFINRFRIPPFLLPIYQAAGIEYGVRWEVLAAINEIETDFGRNVAVSSAGAEGWMQFMPATWAMWGVDGNRDGRKDPGNPVDAIFSAARYLRAAGSATDLRAALFAYNHADWYVDDVLYRARSLSALPGDLVASLTGLADGRFPLTEPTRYRPKGTNTAVLRSVAGAEVVAANDGRIVRVTRTSLVLEDVYGNRYAYEGLGRIAGAHAHARRQSVIPPLKERLYANPERTLAANPGRARHGARVLAGDVLGRLGNDGSMRFRIRPAGKNAPWIAPKPILDGWKLLDRTAIYRVAHSAGQPTAGQVLLMSKDALQRFVLGDKDITLYDCGRRDVQHDLIDRRVLATLGFLAVSGLNPTVTSLQCGHSFLTASGNVSEHSVGSAVDIAAVNGTPIYGHQGIGTITETTIRRLFALQGTMRPHQIISLMDFPEADNTLALGDHYDHIHVGFAPQVSGSRTFEQVLKPGQWRRLADRLATVENPTVKRAVHND